MRTPTLPLGRWAPWLLLAVAVAFAAWGLITGDREYLVIGAIAALTWLVAFPLARAILGTSEEDP